MSRVEAFSATTALFVSFLIWSSDASGAHSLGAAAFGSALAHNDQDPGSTSLTPNPGSLSVTFGAVASDVVVNNSPPPAQWEIEAFALGSGTARYGALSGRARAEASIRPPLTSTVAHGEVNLDVGFLDNALVVSDTLPAGAPVTLTFLMTLEAAPLAFADGPPPNTLDVTAAARLDAQVSDLDNIQQFPGTGTLLINATYSNQINESFRTFNFNTVVGHRLELDVNLRVAAKVDMPFAGFRTFTQGIADVIAGQTGHFFYQPSGDMRLVGESGHDYAIPQPVNEGLFDLVQASASGPPYPVQTIVADVATRLVPPNPVVPVERFKLSLFDAVQPSPPPITSLPLQVFATTAPGDAALDVGFRLSPVDPCARCVDGSALDLLFELEAHPNSGAVPVLIPTDPCVGCNDVSEFDVPFDVFVDGVGTMQHVAHFEINAGQPLLFDNVVIGPPQSPAFHITFDLIGTAGEVTTADNLFLVTVSAALAAALAGDFNDDGSVDAADYVIWRKNPGGIYTQNDFNIWRANFGTMAGGGASSALKSTVPEPCCMTLLLIAAIVGLAGHRRHLP